MLFLATELGAIREIFGGRQSKEKVQEQKSKSKAPAQKAAACMLILGETCWEASCSGGEAERPQGLECEFHEPAL
jgi:hypothetical protein